ncbi:MAG: sigma-70 family RNA polymerase sigma factor [Synergistales bacterium]|nr:sigma-70 family RNA polymerase sigma factor [Synergistales bacterium]
MGQYSYNLEQELERFQPLVKATARRYEGRGAEFDDLVQEGYVALLELIPKCSDPGKLPLYLKERLPARVRAAARREWRHNGLSLEDIEGTGEEPADLEEPSFPDPLMETLGQKEKKIADLLTEGYTQKEISEQFGISQQAVSARVNYPRLKSRACNCRARMC